MKTLHLTNAYHPTSGGIRSFYDSLLGEAARAGVLIRLVVPSDTTRVEDISSHARIYHVRAPHAPCFDRRYRVIWPHRLLAADGPVIRILRDEQPDVVEICDKYSLCYLAGVLRKGWIRGVERPVLVGLSCERMDDNVTSYLRLGRLGAHLSSWYLRHIYLPQFDHHVANSEYTAGELRRQVQGHPRRVSVLPMGVDIERFTPARQNIGLRTALTSRLGGRSSMRLLIYAGRLAKEKNLALLPDILARLDNDGPDYRLLIAGEGPIATDFEAQCAAQIPGRAHFLRHLDRDALANLLANGDAFLHPNPREPFGIAPLEAMASGLPLVGPQEGGVRSYASDDSAWLAPANATDLAQQVRQVFANPAERRRRVDNAVAVAAEYRWERVAQRFFSTYASLVAEARKSPGTGAVGLPSPVAEDAAV